MRFADYSSSQLFDLFQEEKEFRVDMLEELLQRISVGSCVYSKLLPTDVRGIINPIHYVGILMGERQVCPSLHLMRSQEQIEDEIKGWALAHDCWMTESELREQSDCRALYSHGTESVVYIDRNRQNVIKMMHPREGYEVVSIGDLLDGVALYNMVFHGARYEVIGYGRNDAGVFCAICKQPMIIGRTLTKYAELHNLGEKWISNSYETIMHKRGFVKESACWYKDQFLVTDITGSNVVITPDGHAIVVDADVSYRDSSFFGDKVITDI